MLQRRPVVGVRYRFLADDAVIWNGAAYSVAVKDAWCGNKDEAIALLRELASASPGVGPGYIVSDPLIRVPLAREPAFHALSGELERRGLSTTTLKSAHEILRFPC